MFGKRKIEKWLVEFLKQHKERTDQNNQSMLKRISSIQSTNDKRYNEMNNRMDAYGRMITKLEKENEEVEAPGLTDKTKRKFWGDDVVTCDTCKCLLYKDDAIKGESRIVKKNIGSLGWQLTEEGARFGWPKQTEEIETPYYCQAHKEKVCQKKPLKSEGKSKQTKTTSLDKKSKSKVK